jgi:cbb3-type cytochrome oxidase subunit 3
VIVTENLEQLMSTAGSALLLFLLVILVINAYVWWNYRR